jgi:lipopolysaccharide/colanic/teichoic acid biosynthesis glycosyltransferase
MSQYFAENVSSKQYKILGCLQVQERQSTALAAAQAANSHYGTPSYPKVLGHVSELGDLLISKPVHEVIAVQPATDGNWVSQVIRDCDNLGILLRIVPEALISGQPVRLRTLFPFQALHLPAVVLTPPHWDSDALFLKRLIDFVVSVILLVVLSPLFVLIALAIKITTPRLPVLYKWRVVGRNGVEFIGYKFTTMEADAEERKQELLERNEMTGPVFKIKDDPRATRLGRFLRKYSLNELPQLWSVLKGDMSLVGPRPAFRHELERYEFWHKRKLSIKPGITCIWQVRGRNKVHRFDDWVGMDLEYIDNWSLWLDFKILFRTVWAVLAGTGS